MDTSPALLVAVADWEEVLCSSCRCLLAATPPTISSRASEIVVANNGSVRRLMRRPPSFREAQGRPSFCPEFTTSPAYSPRNRKHIPQMSYLLVAQLS